MIRVTSHSFHHVSLHYIGIAPATYIISQVTNMENRSIPVNVTFEVFKAAPMKNVFF
jgi:hypothetical protein